ncbi:MAG: hypothetical protein FJ290_04025 [Planctomycetes bacterium]|nr:hypothetical protein [Planctomycetota bacterium]
MASVAELIVKAVNREVRLTEQQRERLLRALPSVLAHAPGPHALPDGMRMIWGGLKGAVSVVAASPVTAQGGPCIGGGEFTALYFVQAILAAASPAAEITVHISEEVTLPQVEHKHLILLGGPVKNRVTCDVLRRIRKRPFQDHRVRSLLGGRASSHLAKPTADGLWHDYGYILVRQDALHPGRKLYLLAGCYTHGTTAAAGYLTSIIGSTEVGMHFRKPGDIEAIVKVAPSAGGKEWIVRCIEPYVGFGMHNDTDFFDSVVSLRSGRYARVRAELERLAAPRRGERSQSATGFPRNVQEPPSWIF